MRTYRITLWLIITAITGILTIAITADEVSIEDTNRDLIHAYAKAELDRNYELMDDYLAEDFVRHSTSPSAPVIESHDAFIAFLQETAAMFPDYVNTIETMVADETVVAAQVTFTGTFVGNGERVEFPFTAFWQIEDNKITALWVNWNDLVMLPQIGLLPPFEELMAPDPNLPEVEVVKALGAALNNGELETAMSYMADDAYFGTYDVAHQNRGGADEIRTLYDELIAGKFRIETNIVAAYSDNSVLVSHTQTWADWMVEAGLAPFDATEVYVVKNDKIIGIIWIMSSETQERMLAAMASADED